MEIRGEHIIFRNAHESREGTWYSYSTTVSRKRDDGTYARRYYDVTFPRGVVVDNKTKINITDGYMSLREYTDKGGANVIVDVVVVKAFDIVSGGAGHTGASEQAGFTALSEVDVPF